MQAAFHQRLGLALADEDDRLGGGIVAVGRLDDRYRRDVEAALLGHGADAAGRPDQDRRDQPQLRRFDDGFQRDRVAGMRHRRGYRRQALSEGDQPLVAFVRIDALGIHPAPQAPVAVRGRLPPTRMRGRSPNALLIPNWA
jgi:hypothetical protein